MKSANKVSYVFIFTSVFIGVLLLIYFLVGRPVLKYSYSLKAEFEQKQSRLAETQDLVRSQPNPQKAIEEIKVKFQDFQDLVVGKKQIPRLMQSLGQAAGERSITVVSIRQREDIKSEDLELPAGINKIYLEIVLICNYQALAEYIKTVGDLPQAFNAEALTIEKQSEALSPLEAKIQAKKTNQASGLLKAVLVLSTISG
jgi:Tfp pilus assembly protein PilO